MGNANSINYPSSQVYNKIYITKNYDVRVTTAYTSGMHYSPEAF